MGTSDYEASDCYSGLDDRVPRKTLEQEKQDAKHRRSERNKHLAWHLRRGQ